MTNVEGANLGMTFSELLPDIRFSDWRPWSERDRPFQDVDVPQDFGIRGLYLLAVSESKPMSVHPASDAYLQGEVIYIGMSAHVEGRLAGTHDAVTEYQEKYVDPDCRRLWFATWHSEWTNSTPAAKGGAVQAATIAFSERALILGYTRKYGKLPALNHE